MDEHQEKVYQRLAGRYASGMVPWDQELPPPEVIRVLEDRPAGRALDLGCGYGRASIYMARAGWEVDAVDFVPQAAAVAAGRAREAGLDVRFHIASVTDLGFLAGPYDFALDVGCVHALDEKGLEQYHRHLRRLLVSGGEYLLFVRMREETAGEKMTVFQSEEEHRGISEDRLRAVFGDGFELVWVAYGQTLVEDKPAWPSAWFCFRRA
jgi:SAM-dependent methyltransferase